MFKPAWIGLRTGEFFFTRLIFILRGIPARFRREKLEDCWIGPVEAGLESMDMNVNEPSVEEALEIFSPV